MKKLIVLCATAMLLPVACFGDAQTLTEDGKGFPEPVLTFPKTTTAGSVESATLTVVNPGPGDIEPLVVAFSRLGTPELPIPIVDVAARDEAGAVVDVLPRPTAVSPDGVIYTFEGIAEGDSITIEFDLTIPRVDGPAGNAIQVYDGRNPERARGVRLETEVGG